MRVAITGGTGFIGRQLVMSHLERGDRVRLLSRRQVTGLEGKVDVFRANLVDPNADLRSFVEGSDVLYHCAGHLTDESYMHAVHVEGTRRLVEVAAGRIGRWVQLSSVGAYGPRYDEVVREDAVEAPQGIYETTKHQSDVLVAAAAADRAFQHVLLRPSTVYGPEMPNHSLFQLISAVARGLFFFIGSPGAVINYVHVRGVVSALMACATRAEARGRVYLLSDNCSVEEMIEIIATVLGRPVPRLRLPMGPALLIARIFGRISGFPLSESRVRALTRRVVYDGSRIEKELGYRHPVTFDQGFRELVGHWRGR